MHLTLASVGTRAVSCCEMGSRIDLRRMGLRKSRPLRDGHPDIGHPCLFCKRLVQAGDEVGHVPQDPEDEDSGTLVAHWRCIEDGFTRLRGGSRAVAPGTTRRFLESWAGPVKGNAAPASNYPYTSQADFILTHGCAFEWRALPRGVRMGAPRLCFDNAARLALRKPGFRQALSPYRESLVVLPNSEPQIVTIKVKIAKKDPPLVRSVQCLGREVLVDIPEDGAFRPDKMWRLALKQFGVETLRSSIAEAWYVPLDQLKVEVSPPLKEDVRMLLPKGKTIIQPTP